jgi:hypothetical protein
MMIQRLHRAPVAQLDRASAFEAEGREFESLRARHSNPHRYCRGFLAHRRGSTTFPLRLRLLSPRRRAKNPLQYVALEFMGRKSETGKVLAPVLKPSAT